VVGLGARAHPGKGAGSLTDKHRAFLRTAAKHYDMLCALRGEACWLCGAKPKTRRLHIDHDHKTMRIRGLLCHLCNRGLPNRATPEWLEAAAQYLRDAEETPLFSEVAA
jgi:hypothetical protein